MTYDTLKLDKGLYSTSKGFTASLEAIDPSENYIGTELEGLDAYQRQLKRFDIKVSGAGSDTVSKFFTTTDSAALFPEYVSRAVAQGIQETDALSKLIATTTEVDSFDYRSIEASSEKDDIELSLVAEGAEFPQTEIKVKDHLTRLMKRGRMLVASYEALKFQKLDLFTITLKQMGAYIAVTQMSDFISMLRKGDTALDANTLTGGYSYENLLKMWSSLYPFNLTTMLAGPDAVSSIATINEFKDANSASTFGTTGSLVTPFGAEMIINPEAERYIYALDKTCAVEKVQAGGVITEYDKLIDRQLERATISTIYGFSIINPNAIKCFQITE